MNDIFKNFRKEKEPEIMGSYIKYKDKVILTGWPATLAFILISSTIIVLFFVGMKLLFNLLSWAF